MQATSQLRVLPLVEPLCILSLYKYSCVAAQKALSWSKVGNYESYAEEISTLTVSSNLFQGCVSIRNNYNYNYNKIIIIESYLRCVVV